MAFVDNPNSQDSQQVAGAAPLSQGQDSSAPMSGEQAPSNTAASGPTIQSEASGDSQPNTMNKKAPKASSGMFTNIQKYVEKNKPQAQKMAGAVTQDVGKQAEQIRQAATEKQNQQQQALQANQQVMDTNKNWAQEQVQNIMQSSAEAAQPAQEQQPSMEDIQSRFQDLASGNIQGVGSVADLNLTSQNARSQALQQLAQSANTEEGRRNLLGQTFEKQGDYTRGMSGLDNLITSGDANAREALITGTQQTTDQLGNQLSDIQSQQSQAKAAQDLALSNFGQDITGIATGASSTIDTQLQTAMDNEIADRMAAGENYQSALANAETTYNQYLQDLGSVDSLQDVAGILKGADTGLGRRGESVFGKLAKGKDVSFLGNSSLLARVNEDRLRSAVDEIAGRYNTEGFSAVDTDKVWSDLWKGSKSSSKAGEDQFLNKESLVNAFKNLQGQLQERAKGGDISEALKKQTGVEDLDSYFSAKNLDKYDLASQDDITRLNSLNRLIGKQDMVVPEQIQNQTRASALSDLLKRYSK